MILLKFILRYLSILPFLVQITIAQEINLVGVTSIGGGTIFNLNTNTSETKRLVDFANGDTPYGELMLSNDRLWGMARSGGSHNAGIIFSLDQDGKNFTKIHDFDIVNGQFPIGSLIESNGKLWGVTTDGGASEYGVIFNLNTDGTGFAIVHEFSSESNGIHPTGSLVEYDGRLWGVTSSVGVEGVIYSIDVDGTDYVREHQFNDSDDGTNPDGKLVVADDKLWGVARNGGANGSGVIFFYDPEIIGFRKIHDFDNTNGDNPVGGLLLIEDTFYGMTRWGGAENNGIIFKIGVDEDGFQNMHEFDATNGNNPQGVLHYDGSKIWGMTTDGGFGSADGIVFSINEDGTSFSKNYDFDGIDGNRPIGGLVLIEDILWGMTSEGGVGNLGVIFNINPSDNSYSLVHDFANTDSSYKPNGGLIESGGKLWGMSKEGGINGDGTIFRLDLDGTNYEKIHDFEYDNGSEPFGRLTVIDGKFWGTTAFGGSSIGGIIFTLDLDGTNFTKIHDFSSTFGRRPYGQLVESNGKVWGMTYDGGFLNYGTIFRIDLDGNNFERLHSFNSTNGRYPFGSLTEYDGKLWGMTSLGGANGKGVIFSVDAVDAEFVVEYDFDVDEHPRGSFIEIDGHLWGTAYEGGSLGNGGSIFSYDVENSIFTRRFNFTNGTDNGIRPFGQLILSGDRLWGMTEAGGENLLGVIYSINTDGSDFRNELDLSYSIGGTPTGNSEHVFCTLLETVVKLEQVISFSIENKEYGDPDFMLDASSNSPNLITYESSDPSIVDVDGSTASILNAGTVTITASQVEDETYQSGQNAQLITIGKANLTATADDREKVFGEENPVFTITYSSFVNGDTSDDIDIPPTPSTIASNSSNVGNYSISLSGGMDDNYEISNEEGTLVIVKASQEIQFEDLPTGLAADSPDFNLEVISTSGLEVELTSSNTDVLDILDFVAKINSAGQVLITAAQTGNNNFNAAEPVTKTVSIEEVLSLLNLDEIKIYPNPTSDFFRLQKISEKVVKLSLIDLNGRQIKSFKRRNGSSYQVEGINPGTYLLLGIGSDFSNLLGKVIIEK